MPAAAQVLELIASLPEKPQRVLLDGPSGSGKTTLANRLAADGYQVLHLDDWYPGWGGLTEGSRIAERLLTGELSAYPEWDWEKQELARWVPVDLSRPFVMEGCGVLTPLTKAHSDLALWLDVPLPVARERALIRDGDAYLPWWDKWHRQERNHWQVNQPRRLADHILS